MDQMPPPGPPPEPPVIDAPQRRGRVDAKAIALVTLAVLAVFYTLYLAAEIILPLLIALILNLLLQPARRFLSLRLKVPAPLASVLLILVLFGIVGAIGFAISLPASNWIARAPQSLPQLQQKLGALKAPIDYARHGMEQLEHLLQQQPAGQQTVAVQPQSNLSGVGLSVLAGTRAAMSQVFTVIVVLFFLLTSGDTLLRRLVEVMPRLSDKKRVVEIGEEIERNISGYLGVITFMNLLVGAANGLSAWACGLPDPLLWATVAFLLNYIPILGPFTGVVVFFFVGLFTYDQLAWAFLPAGIYLAIHVAEGETITPMLLASRFTLNPVMVIVALFFWDFMWGVTGALLAVPLLAIIKITCDRIPPLSVIGHMLGGPPGPRASAQVPLNG
jgi:predicted PurR-regulated permease PerM